MPIAAVLAAVVAGAFAYRNWRTVHSYGEAKAMST
jgi:hypothetical protein